MRAQIVLAAMGTIASMCDRGALVMAGMTKEDWTKLSGPAPWLGSDRNRIVQHFHSMLFGTSDAVGLPRFQLPAEWIAAGIAMFVHDTNLVAACGFFNRAPLTEGLTDGSDVAPCTSSQLLSLVLCAKASTDCGKFAQLFERNTGIAIREKQTVPADKKG